MKNNKVIIFLFLLALCCSEPAMSIESPVVEFSFGNLENVKICIVEITDSATVVVLKATKGDAKIYREAYIIEDKGVRHGLRNPNKAVSQWDYAIVKEGTETKIEFEPCENTKTKFLDFINGDANCLLGIHARNVKYKYHKIRFDLPKDEYATEWFRYDSVEVAGEIMNYDSEEPQEIHCAYISMSQYVEEKTKIDSNGRFSIRFPVNSPVYFTVFLRNGNIFNMEDILANNVYARPGDRLELTMNTIKYSVSTSYRGTKIINKDGRRVFSNVANNPLSRICEVHYSAEASSKDLIGLRKAKEEELLKKQKVICYLADHVGFAKGERELLLNALEFSYQRAMTFLNQDIENREVLRQEANYSHFARLKTCYLGYLVSPRLHLLYNTKMPCFEVIRDSVYQSEQNKSMTEREVDVQAKLNSWINNEAGWKPDTRSVLFQAMYVPSLSGVVNRYKKDGADEAVLKSARTFFTHRCFINNANDGYYQNMAKMRMF